MKIVVDKMPEKGLDCIFFEMAYNCAGKPCDICGIDGHACELELEYGDYCEKLITLEDLIANGRNRAV